jgi:S-adenosylmethionine hydrolase
MVGHPQMSHIITLTTDFGYKDPFTAEMKGVILSLNSSSIIVDITHGIEPFNILEAAFVIGSSFKYFPSHTVHIVVVDPSVGSDRRSIIIEAGDHFFVGPDNGVFSAILQGASSTKCFHIANQSYMLAKESPTFQGRDIFAPVAAWLLNGISPSDVGPEISDPTVIIIPRSSKISEGLSGKVIYVDQFGNAITNITAGDLEPFATGYTVQIKENHFVPVNHYAQSSADSLSCLVNSSGHLEIFTSRNNASRLFGIGTGDAVFVRPIMA